MKMWLLDGSRLIFEPVIENGEALVDKSLEFSIHMLTLMNGLKQRVLVLNRLWQAVNVVEVPRAFRLLLQDHAQVIYNRTENLEVLSVDDWLLRSVQDVPDEPGSYVTTVKMRIRIPKVLLLRTYDKLPAQEIRFNRQTLFERDEYRCQYCGKHFEASDLNMDHVIPRAMGGRTTWENIVTCCLECNARKADRLPHQANMRLLRKPERPRWRPFVSSMMGDAIDKEWACFMPKSKSEAEFSVV